MRTRSRNPRDARARDLRGRRPGAGNSVRIVGGEWRGRRLRFPDVPGLRPTPDRVRETLFNWLAPGIAGARCLDLFAGTGALGLEALSRGAAAVVLVERDAHAMQALRQSVEAFGAAGRATLVEQAAEIFLAGAADRFDIVFLDPPFDQGVLPAIVATLQSRGLLAPGARVYLECRADEAPPLPDGWRLHRSGRAGDVGYHLAVCPDGGGRGGQAATAPDPQ